MLLEVSVGVQNGLVMSELFTIRVMLKLCFNFLVFCVWGNKSNQALMTITSFLRNSSVTQLLKEPWWIHSPYCDLWPSWTHRIPSGTPVQQLLRWAWWKPPQCLSPLRRWPLWPCYQLSSASPSSFGSSAWAGPRCPLLPLKAHEKSCCSLLLCFVE